MPQVTLKQESRQTQALTPRLQQAVRLLQLSALDYEAELHEMMHRNPFLELDESAAAKSRTADIERDKPAAEHEPDPVGAASKESDLDSSWNADSWQFSPGSLRDGRSESGASASDLIAVQSDMREHLHSQANLLPLSARDHALVYSVIESLDDDGYLRLALDEVGALAQLETAADACETSTALRLVQSFEPAGIGARSVGECLTLQLDKVDPIWRELARRILDSHLDLLARRDVAGIASRLGRDAREVDGACQALRRLDPRPGWRFGAHDSQHVTPDVTVRKVRGQWVAQLNGAIKPRFRLNKSCTELFQRHARGHHAELGAHLQEARWTLRNIEQRFSTILEVSQAILRRQHLFFEHGPLAMKPLALRDIAQELGVHESTVCRVTNNKYMATPAGLFELKHFFSRPMPMTNGGSSTGTAIRSVVRELIESEDPGQPLSDVAIAQRLAREGLTVARRTVTKYRLALKIAPADQRRLAQASR